MAKDVVFGTLVVIAVFAGCELAYLRGKRTGLTARHLVDACIWAIVTGFIVSHLAAVVLYRPALIRENPLSLLTVWAGMSSYGGLFGGMGGIYLGLRRKGLPLLPYYEALTFGFVPVWILGRLGCTVAFDHPGPPTDFFLGMADGAGVVRHNLGFYEMLLAVFMTVILYGLRNWYPFRGFHAVLVILMYAPARFALDTLRISDPRYLGWTPGQYGSVLLLGLGIILFVKHHCADPSDGPGKAPAGSPGLW